MNEILQWMILVGLGLVAAGLLLEYLGRFR